MIRVCQVFACLDRGGAETLCMNIYRNLDREKVQFDFIKHTTQKGAYEDEIKELGGKIYVAPPYKVINHISYVRWWRRFLAEHPELQIVHGHYFTISAIYLSIAQKLGRVAIAHSHCNRNEEPYRFLKDYFTNQIKNHCDMALACSNEAGDWLFGSGNYIVLKNAIDINKFKFRNDSRNRIRDEFNIDNELVVGTVGRFSPQKNPYGIVDIAKELYKIRADVKLLWVGDGLMMSEIKEYTQKNGLDDVIIFTGVRSDVNEILSAMDVFLLPSNFEGLGIVLIEAQANGIPCLASNEVPREVNVTGKVGFLPLTDYGLWAEEIISVNKKRYAASDELKEAGYEIRDCAYWMQKEYLDTAESDTLEGINR